MLSWALLMTVAAASDQSVDAATLTRAKEVEWNGYYRRRDAAGLEKFLHPEFVLLNSDGTTEGRSEAVKWVRENDWSGATTGFRYRVTKIQFPSPDTANVFGNGTYDGSDDKGKCRMQYTSSNIFVRTLDGWHPIFSHTSDAACLRPKA